MARALGFWGPWTCLFAAWTVSVFAWAWWVSTEIDRALDAVTQWYK